jgi:hypothetical protein
MAGGLGLVGCRTSVADRRVAPSLPRDAREFGVALDPWNLDDWSAAIGAKPTMVMEFEQFSRNRTIDAHFAEARRQGVRSFMITWEPWQSVSAALGKVAQHKEQPAYSNAAIATGKLDGYIHRFARSVAAGGLHFYVRYAHEMNGDWYPWSRDPANYILAWRRVVDIFRAEKVDNAKFIFSMNPSIWIDEKTFEAAVRQYWPGDDYVDYIGSTMINFGGRKSYTVAEFAARLIRMRAMFRKDAFVTEMNTDADVRVAWLAELRAWLATQAPWVRGIVLSPQGSSRGETQLGSQVGDLSWNVMTDPQTQPVIRGLAADMTGSR